MAGYVTESNKNLPSRLVHSKEDRTESTSRDEDDSFTFHHDQLCLEQQVQSTSDQARKDFLQQYSFSSKSALSHRKNYQRFESSANNGNAAATAIVPTLMMTTATSVPDAPGIVSSQSHFPNVLGLSSNTSPIVSPSTSPSIEDLASKLESVSKKWNREKEMLMQATSERKKANKFKSGKSSKTDKSKVIKSRFAGESGNVKPIPSVIIITEVVGDQNVEPTTTMTDATTPKKKKKKSSTSRQLTRSESASSLQYLPSKYSVNGAPDNNHLQLVNFR